MEGFEAMPGPRIIRRSADYLAHTSDVTKKVVNKEDHGDRYSFVSLPYIIMDFERLTIRKLYYNTPKKTP